MSIRRQSTVQSVGAFPLLCNSQAKVTAWLQSSDDMDKCSKGVIGCVLLVPSAHSLHQGGWFSDGCLIWLRFGDWLNKPQWLKSGWTYNW